MTTQPKHTPVEWFQKPTAGHETHGQSAIYSDTGSTIAVVYDGKKHAAFIVRACNCHEELVAACQDIVEVFNEWKPEDDPTTVLEWFSEAASKARAALAKAKEQTI